MTIEKAMHDLGRSLIGTEAPARGHYSVHIRAHHGDKWTAQGTLPVGEPYQYISGDVAVFIDFNDEEAADV